MRYLLFLTLSLLLSLAQAQSLDSLRAIYSSYVGVRELTHRNDGPEVERFLAHVGLKKGAPWCAAFVSYCLHKAGYTDAPRSGWSPAYFPRRRRVWSLSEKYIPPHADSTPPYHAQIGDLFGIWYANLGRIAHVGFIDVPNGTSKYEVESDELRVTSAKTQEVESDELRVTSAKTQNVGARRASPVNNDNTVSSPIRHSSFVIRNSQTDMLVTVEGNTNDNGSREGIGVFRKYRPLKSIKYIARWTTASPQSLASARLCRGEARLAPTIAPVARTLNS